MTITKRILLAIAIVLVDLAAFVLPLTALLVAYVIIVNPPWFRAFVENINGGE